MAGKKAEAAETRVTRDAVARAAGVSGYTVSKAISGQVGISEKTRARVLKVAEALGYRPSPAAQHLALMRSRREVGTEVAYLNIKAQKGMEGVWYEGSSGQLATYVLAGFASGEMATRILWSRGIRGLLLRGSRVGVSQEMLDTFGWDRFAVVQGHRQTEQLKGHVVRHSAFEYITMALKTVYRRGYRRIAVLLLQSGSQEDDYVREAALCGFREAYKLKGVECVWRVLASDNEINAEEAKWLKACAPQAIVVFNAYMISFLPKLGFTVPDSVGVAAIYTEPAKNDHPAGVSGCLAKDEDPVREQIVLLKDLINRGEYGFTDRPTIRVVEPDWYEGGTLPERS